MNTQTANLEPANQRRKLMANLKRAGLALSILGVIVASSGCVIDHDEHGDRHWHWWHHHHDGPPPPP